MTFVKGLELSRQFYLQAVRPILEAQFPGLSYAAALIGSGSEVLGFDTGMSSDHHWGPRVMLFVPAEAGLHVRPAIQQVMADHLPVSFMGYPTNFSPPNPQDNGVRLLQGVSQGPVAHRVEVFALDGFFQEYLGVDLSAELMPAGWLTLQEQRLLGVTGGEVFHDGLAPAGLEAARARFAYYPSDVWLYLLAAQWMKIGQEEPFVGRCGSVGDELGSRLVAARLVAALMRLCFLMEKRYAPYSKWFGTAFSRLDCAGQFMPLFEQVFQAATWPERQQPLCMAYKLAARQHNGLGITPPLPEQVSNFHGRPFQVIHGEIFAEAIAKAIHSPDVRALPAFAGSVNQFLESVDVLDNLELCGRLKGLFHVSLV
jgi:hypothetical protein